MPGRFPDLRRALVAPLLVLAVVLLPSCQQDASVPTAPDATSLAVAGRGQQPDLSAALAAQARYTGRLIALRDVVGTAVGLDANGAAAVQIFTTGPEVRGLPARLDGVPVSVVVTGAIRPIPAGNARGAGSKIAPTSRFARPVP